MTFLFFIYYCYYIVVDSVSFVKRPGSSKVPKNIENYFVIMKVIMKII